MHFDCKKKNRVSFRLINFAKDHVVDYENITKLSIGCLGFFKEFFDCVYQRLKKDANFSASENY